MTPLVATLLYLFLLFVSARAALSDMNMGSGIGLMFSWMLFTMLYLAYWIMRLAVRL